MARISRRAWLQAALGASAMLSSRLSLGGGGSPSRAEVRHVVQILLPGGVDQIFTTAPRVAADVAPGVDVPYPPDVILGAGPVPLGPHLAGLARHARRVTILHGVRNLTAGHISGGIHVTRLRSRVGNGFPGFVEVFGEHRRGPLLGAVNLNTGADPFLPGALIGGEEGAANDGSLRRLATASPVELRALETALGREAAGLERLGGDERARLAGHLRAAAALYRLLPGLPPIGDDDWGVDRGLSRPLQTALWLIEHDVAAGILVVLPGLWDTHLINGPVQTYFNLPAFQAIGRFLDELHAPRGAAAAHAARTLVLVGSEMGRFPRLNARKGKDHSPEIPILLFDPAGGGRGFGALGRELEALPISTATGRAGTEPPMSIDDVGASLLRRLGIDPAPHGHLGRRLAFLEA